MLLMNPAGRLVEIEEADLLERSLRIPGFRAATDEEEAEYLAQRQAWQQSVRPAGSGLTELFYKTVAANADGYGMSRDLLATELKTGGIVVSETYKQQKVGLLYNYPYSILQLNTDVRLLYTMFESDKIPEEWPEYLEAADEVIVPSNWCADTFERAGVKRPTVVPLGYNDRVFKPIERDLPMEAGRDFTFIHYNSFNIRKGFREVLEAFTQEFADNEPVKLILKTTFDHPPVPILKSVYPNIEVVTGKFSELELWRLLGRADCMVYPSRGEGFGITPLEAMATGLPAIVPNAHGISEYFNADYMREVRVAEKCPAMYNRFKGVDVGQMVICDIGDLRKQMRWAYNHQSDARELGRKAQTYVQQWTYRNAGRQLREIIERWQKADIVRRPDSEYLKVEVV